MPYRILSFSGGRGIFQAKLLDYLENELGAVWTQFDLIAGTSTGAIIALALALGKTPSQVVSLFQKDGPKIFRKPTPAWTQGPFYSNYALHDALKREFKDKTLADCAQDVAIVSTDLNDFTIRVFSALTQDSDASITAFDAAMASTAAPAYFKAWKIGSRAYVDGGIWGNTPSLAAITLANEKKMIDFRHIRLLNIGNGESSAGSTMEMHNRKRPVEMPFYLMNMFFATQSDMAREVVTRLLGANRVHHIDIPLKPFIDLDDVTGALRDLPRRAEEEAIKEKDKVERFINDED